MGEHEKIDIQCTRSIRTSNCNTPTARPTTNTNTELQVEANVPFPTRCRTSFLLYTSPHFIPTSEHQQPLTASRIHLKIPRKCNHMHNQNKHPSLEHTPKITTTHCLFTFPLTSTSTCAHKEQIRKKSTTTEQEKKSKKRKTPKKTNKTQSYITTTLLQSLRVPQSRPQ